MDKATLKDLEESCFQSSMWIFISNANVLAIICTVKNGKAIYFMQINAKTKRKYTKPKDVPLTDVPFAMQKRKKTE